MCAFAPKTAIVFGIGLVSKLMSTLSVINDQYNQRGSVAGTLGMLLNSIFSSRPFRRSTRLM